MKLASETPAGSLCSTKFCNFLAIFLVYFFVFFWTNGNYPPEKRADYAATFVPVGQKTEPWNNTFACQSKWANLLPPFLLPSFKSMARRGPFRSLSSFVASRRSIYAGCLQYMSRPVIYVTAARKCTLRLLFYARPHDWWRSLQCIAVEGGHRAFWPIMQL